MTSFPSQLFKPFYHGFCQVAWQKPTRHCWVPSTNFVTTVLVCKLNKISGLKTRPTGGMTGTCLPCELSFSLNTSVCFSFTGSSRLSLSASRECAVTGPRVRAIRCSWSSAMLKLKQLDLTKIWCFCASVSKSKQGWFQNIWGTCLPEANLELSSGEMKQSKWACPMNLTKIAIHKLPQPQEQWFIDIHWMSRRLNAHIA